MSRTFIAGLDTFLAEVKGERLLGGFYRASGNGLRPTAIFLHGVPGVEKNMDLLYRLREAGWNALYFHYRGSWGSGGNYDFAGHHDDIAAALDWVVQQPSVDPERLMLIGSSMGGYNTLMFGAREPRIRNLVSLCPLIDPSTADLGSATFAEFASMLHGVTADDLARQWASVPAVTTVATQLQQKRVLLITGDQDEIFAPSHYEPLMQQFPQIQWLRHADGDHQFSSCRPWLRERIIEWLGK